MKNQVSQLIEFDMLDYSMEPGQVIILTIGHMERELFSACGREVSYETFARAHPPAWIQNEDPYAIELVLREI